MKLLFDFFPTLLFLIAYFTGKSLASSAGVPAEQAEIQGLMYGIPIMAVATAIQLLYNWFKHRKVEKLHLIAFALLIVFGGIAMMFQSKLVLALKVSVVNWLFAIVFLAVGYMSDKNLVQRIMEKSIELPAEVYRVLNNAYILFFIFIGVVNLLVYFTVAFDNWVLFKLFGLLGFMFLFMIGQVVYLRKHIPEEALAGSGPETQSNQTSSSQSERN